LSLARLVVVLKGRSSSGEEGHLEEIVCRRTGAQENVCGRRDSGQPASSVEVGEQEEVRKDI